MFSFNWSYLFVTLFVAYIAQSIYSLYTLFHPAVCRSDGPKCLIPMIQRLQDTQEFPPLQLRIYASVNKRPENYGRIMDQLAFLDIDEVLEKEITIDLPEHTRNNGSLYIHSFLLPAEFRKPNPFEAEWRIVKTAQMTVYQVPEAKAFGLMSKDQEDDEERESAAARSTRQLRETGTPVTHFRSVLPLTVVGESPKFDLEKIAPEIFHRLDLFQKEGQSYYWPIFYIDELSFRAKDLVQIKPEDTSMKLKIFYRPLSIGKFRFLTNIHASLLQFKDLGFSEKEIDEMKGIFVDTNFYFLALTMLVASTHLVLDGLAFKNDISFWRGKKSMVGLSTRTILWRCFSQIVIFLYLLNEESSLLVTVPMGIGCLIEFWKVSKALKMSVVFISGIPRLRFGTKTETEAETDAIDSESMKYLALLLTPLCIGGAIYSLMYVPHKSWYSWVIECVANGVYAFGFLFMLPQLFVNYRLKSVAHLPWRAFMYKACNTFIDDIFAFIISMPTSHRLACFRDDIVFVIYLYQRYLYPVDKTRVNEFGEKFAADSEKSLADSKDRRTEKAKSGSAKKHD